MKLTLRIPLVTALIIMSSLAVGLFGITKMNGTLDELSQVVNGELAHERSINKALSQFKTQVQEWKNVLLRGSDQAQREKYWAAFEKREMQVNESIESLLLVMPDREISEILNKFKTAHSDMGRGYRQGFEAFVAADYLSEAGDKAVKGMDRAPAELLAKAAGIISEQALTSLVAAEESRESTLFIINASMAIVAFIGLLAALWLARSIINQLGGDPTRVQEVVEQISAGNLTTVVQLSKGDQTSLMAAIERMRLSLLEMISQVHGSSADISNGAEQISSSGDNLKVRVDQLASSLEETAASMDELGATVKGNSAHAQEANDLAKGTTAVAIRGGEVVDEVVGTMREINESSHKISDIIGVIDSIAFQTNLLALNAAVEAARAGEQGRGFAVVASEVRALAHRSAEAANEIKSLINDSVDRIDRGSTLVDQAGSTMTQVVDSVKQVSELIGQISHASIEQSNAVLEVGRSVTGMDQATQQSAEVVEQSAMAARVMRKQTDTLVKAISLFQITAQKFELNNDVQRNFDQTIQPELPLRKAA